jgi:hypothetical protein
MSLFQNIVLKKYLAADSDKIAAAYSRFAKCFLDLWMPRIAIHLPHTTTQITTTDQQIDRMVYGLKT